MDMTYKGMKAAWWIILLEAVAILGGGFAQVYIMSQGVGEYAAMALSQVCLIIPIAVGCLYLRRLYPYDSMKNLVAAHTFQPAMVFMLLILPAATQYFAAFVQLPFTDALVRIFGEQTDMIGPKNVEELLWLFVSLSIAAPLVEELFFRGIIFRILEPYGTLMAVVVSAFGFALLHFHPSVFIMIFIVGIVLGFVRVYSGSVFSCILFHAMFNFQSLQQIVFAKELEALVLYQGLYALVMICLFPVLSLISYLLWGRGKSYPRAADTKLGGLVPLIICILVYAAMSVMLVIGN